MSYVDFAAAVSEENCNTTNGAMDKYVNSQSTDQAKLQASSTCTAYQIGRRDMMLNIVEENSK